MSIGPVFSRLFAAPLEPPATAPQAMTEQHAVQVLNRDFGLFDTAAKGGSPDGHVSRHDLEAVRDDASASPQQRDAAQYLLEHDQLRNAIDTAAQGGAPDNTISRNDLTVYTVQQPSALPVLQSRQVEGSADNPTILHVDASAPAGADWSNRNGNNAGIASVYVDGKYFADATILTENPQGVDVNLGVLDAGSHTIELRDTTAVGTGGSPSGISDLRLSTRQLDVHAADPGERDSALAARYAPIVHLQDNGQATNNTPLLTSARVTHHDDGTTTIRYSILYTNEDGGDGTDPGNLANRWGRTTDDEAVFAVTVNDASGKIVDVQSNPDGGVGSGGGATSQWAQNSINGRPELTIVDAHNRYAWASDHPYRAQNRVFSGAPVLATSQTTIDVMNAHPWTWQVSSSEIRREDKLGKAQPYDRIYLNLQDGQGSTFRDATKVEVVLNDGRVVTVGDYHAGDTIFNFGDNRLNASNNVSIVLPEGVAAADVAQVRVDGLPGDARVQAQRLSTDDRPVAILVGG